MKPVSVPPAALLAIFTLCNHLPASAEEIVLRQRYLPGDSYVLSLRTSTQTRAFSEGRTRHSFPFEEDVELDYDATVLVLEVDPMGNPVRERHQGVSLSFQRADDSGSLFGKNTSYEVRREEDGRVGIFVNGEPVESRIEKVVAEILEGQFEHTLGPTLFEPGRPVEIGETWRLDRSVTRRFLHDAGIRVIEFWEPATATLVRRQGRGGRSELVIDYNIPVARFQLEQMPPEIEAMESEAFFTGQIRLPTHTRGNPIVYSSNVEVSLSGVGTEPGRAHAAPWIVRSSEAVRANGDGTRERSHSFPWWVRSSKSSEQRTVVVPRTE